MKVMGSIFSFVALAMCAHASAQSLTYAVSPAMVQGYAKVSLNTTFQLDLDEGEADLVSTTGVDAGWGISAAAGLQLLPDVDGELELAIYSGTIDYRTVAGVPTLSIPKEKVRLVAAFSNVYYKFQPDTNARFKLGGGLGFGEYRLTDTTGRNHRGTGLVYQVKSVAEYDFGARTTFHAEVGYLGTTDIDVDVVGSTIARESSLSGITFGLGGKVKF